MVNPRDVAGNTEEEEVEGPQCLPLSMRGRLTTRPPRRCSLLSAAMNVCSSPVDLFRQLLLLLFSSGISENAELLLLECGRSAVYSRLRGENFAGSSHASDLKIGTPVAALPGAWRYGVRAGTGRPGVIILRLGNVESLVSNFYLSVAGRTHCLRRSVPEIR